MLIKSKYINAGDLELDAYSFSETDIDAVAFVLDRAKINAITEPLAKDRQGRHGLRFIVDGLDVLNLQQALNLKFSTKDSWTKVVLGETYLHADGGGASSFKCSRVDTPPDDCKTIHADNQKAATVVCALVANTNNWLGGVVEPGEC